MSEEMKNHAENELTDEQMDQVSGGVKVKNTLNDKPNKIKKDNSPVTRVGAPQRLIEATEKL